jgi:hypothetical protein
MCYTPAIMIHAPILRRSVWMLTVATCLSPLAAFAATATPQQMIDANLQRLSTTQPASVSGEVNLNVTEKPVQKTASGTSGSVSFTFNSRTVPSEKAVPNSEGDLSITSFESSGTGFSIPTLINPATLEWKSINGTGYVRIAALADVIKSLLSGMGVNIDALIGTWVKLDPSSIPACTDQSVCGAGAAIASQNQADLANILKSPIKVTRTEKKWTASNGDAMIRVRGKINPTVITNLQNRDLKAVDAKAKDRAAKIKAINTSYAELRKITGSIEFALNINQTDGTVERAELGMSQNRPMKTCTTNKWKITTCKTTSNVKTSLLMGLNFSQGKPDAIVAPDKSITVDDLIGLLK